MHIIKKISLLFTFIFLAGCSFRGHTVSTMFCENFFTLTDDFNHKYPEQGNYFDFISSSYLTVEARHGDKRHNCHYYLKYKNGDVVDKHGFYEIKGNIMQVTFGSNDYQEYTFSLYNSPTIDYILIGGIEHGGTHYNLVYAARYLYSAKG